MATSPVTSSQCQELATLQRQTADAVARASESVVGPWPRIRWVIYMTLFVLFGAYLGLNSYIETRRALHPVAGWKPFLWEMSSVVIIGLLVPFIIRLEDRFRIDSQARARVIFAHIGGVFVFSATHVVGIVLLRKFVYLLVGERYNFGNVFAESFFEWQRDLITYVTVLVCVVGYREFRKRRARELRASQLAAELSEARLRHLTAQIEPHFLFNSLNAISNRMHEDVAAADRMISQLSDLLRAAYESDRQMLVPLERELGWLRNYAAMMAERFRGQLVFEIEIEPGLEMLQVPRLLLQPIVENALRHGLSDGHGCVRVDVRRDERRLKYTVSDDGAGFPDTPFLRGTGISNISRRLELLFPGDHGLEFGTRQPHGAVVTVSFPVTA